MYKKLIFMTAVMCIGINYSCMAENTVNISIDNTMAEIKGTWENAGFLNFQILPAEYDRSLADTLISDIGVMFSDYAASDGTYSEIFEMPDELKGGKYRVYVSDGQDEQIKEFFYVNYEETKPIIEKINSKILTSTEFETIVKENAEKFGVDGAELAKYADNIIKPLYNARGEYTVDSFGRECRCAIVSEKLKDETTADVLIEEYASDFGIDYKEDYAVLTDGEKKEFISKYNSKDKSSGNYCITFVNCLVETRLSNCSNYTQYGDILIKYADKLKINLDKYNKLSSESKAKVLDSLYTDKEFDANMIVSAFYAKVEKYAAATPSYSGGGSSSGGGSGGNSVPSISEPPSVIDNKEKLPDVSGHWAEQQIRLFEKNGVVSGFPDGNFYPESEVTRSQFVKILTQILKLDGINEKIFDDVTEDNWNFSNIGAAVRAGIISGYDGKFMPDALITRQDCAVILYNAMKYKGIILNGSASFDDKDEISDYAVAAVGALSNSGILKGYVGESGNNFKPKKTATRAEAVTMIYKFSAEIN